MTLRALALAAVLVLAGCAAPVANSPGGAGDAGSPTATPTPDRDTEDPFADPDTDVVGWEDGYWFDEPIDVDQSDGLSDAELDAFVSRAMARVEQIRRLEFEKRVPVSVISRAEYRNRTRGGGGGGGPSDFDRWNNQVWEALFITGERQDSQSAIGEARGSSVIGFYSSRDDEIKLVTEDPENPVLRNSTLVHELVHGLQDQHFDLTKPRFRGRTQDGDLAIDGVVEGDANLVERIYAERCAREWDCVPTPEQSSGGSGGGGSGGGPNLGILLTTFQPYSDGPAYVSSLRQRGGWEAVNDAYDSLPVSTEQVIHVTDEEPERIRFSDRSRNGWSTFPNQGERGSDTVGEASMYAMFWYQARAYDADTIDTNGLFDTEGPYDLYNYAAPPSAGWANDRVFPYQQRADGETQYGYVWVTRWDTEADAREFRDAYLRMLDAHDVEERGDGLYVVPEGEFADAFRVVVDGRTVTIVNGPTPADVNDIRPT